MIQRAKKTTLDARKVVWEKKIVDAIHRVSSVLRVNLSHGDEIDPPHERYRLQLTPRIFDFIRTA